MDTTYRIRLIVAVAVASVALTIAVAGIASANPPVPPPNETSLIETSTDVTVSGTYYEETTFDWTYSTKELNDTLENDERVAQIQYDAHTSATDGYFEIKKGLTADGQNTPNLKVDAKVGFVKGNAVTSSLDLTENVGMSNVAEGDTAGGTGVGALCPWAQNACIPPTNTFVAAGSQLKDVTLVNSHTITTVATTESPQVHYEINAKGPIVEGGNETLGMGTIAAGMKVRTMEGLNCNRTHPLASRLTYSELSRATGAWKFAKSMTHTAQIPVINEPNTYPMFPF